MREYILNNPVIQGGRNRAFASGAVQWNSVNTYNTGALVSLPPNAGNFSGGNTYNEGDITAAGDGEHYISLVGGNIANNPFNSGSPDFWARVPKTYLQALSVNQNKTPVTFNTYSQTPEDQIWMQVPSDEPIIDMQQEYGLGDNTNNVLIFKPVLHENDHKVGIWINSPQLDRVRNIRIFDPHFHYVSQAYIDSGNAEVGQQVYDNIAMVYVGQAERIKIRDGHVRLAGDSDDSIACIIGNELAPVTSIASFSCNVTGEGERQVGYLIQNLTQTNSLDIDADISMTGVDSKEFALKTNGLLTNTLYGREIREGVGTGGYIVTDSLDSPAYAAG